MLDALGGADEAGIPHGIFGIFADEFRALFDETFHRLAFVAAQLLADHVGNLIQPFHVPLGLFQVFFETGLQFLIRGSFGHFRQRFYQLVFGAVEVLQFVMKKVFNSVEFHTFLFALRLLGGRLLPRFFPPWETFAFLRLSSASGEYRQGDQVLPARQPIQWPSNHGRESHNETHLDVAHPSGPNGPPLLSKFMKALVFHHPGKVSVDNVPDPQLQHPQDIILRVTSTAICGSDLHIYNGFFPQVKDMIMGHEFMGIVEEIGGEVTAVRPGDRLVVPFPVACGACFFCTLGLPGHCENSNPEKYGPEGAMTDQKGGGLFGYTDLYGGYDGGQAQYVRVPYANFGPRKVLSDLADEQILFLTDIFPTGYTSIDWAALKGGETVAVFGCGPVGLMAMKCAWLKGAGRVIGVDILPYRLEAARRASRAETIDASQTDPVQAIRDLTEGRGADVCVDAVGMEADRNFLDKVSNVFHAQAGSIKALCTAISAVRRGGVVTVVGVYGMPYDHFPLGQIFDKGITMRFGQAPVQKYIDELIEVVQQKRVVLDDVITHRLPLEQAPHAYDIFCRKEDNCVKVVLKP